MCADRLFHRSVLSLHVQWTHRPALIRSTLFQTRHIMLLLPLLLNYFTCFHPNGVISHCSSNAAPDGARGPAAAAGAVKLQLPRGGRRRQSRGTGDLLPVPPALAPQPARVVRGGAPAPRGRGEPHARRLPPHESCRVQTPAGGMHPFTYDCY